MIIKWSNELHGPAGFTVTPEDYDGTPRLFQLLMDVAPKVRHWDRQAVAAFLTFGKSFGGPVTMPHKFSPAVSNAIKAMALPVQLDLQPIEYYPKALPIGERRLHVIVDEQVPASLLSPQNQRDGFIEVLRSDLNNGALRRINGLTLGSNAWVHSTGSALESWYPYIAVACLFAEDLDASTIVLPSEVDTDSPLWLPLCNLLATARLGLEVVE